MKATTRLSQYRSRPIVLLDEYKKEPIDHAKYKWTTQEGKVLPVESIDDNHLMNIFRMLDKSLAYHKDLDDSVFMFGEPQGDMAMDMYTRDMHNLCSMIYMLEENISHIGYEIYKRGLLINQFEKFKIIEDEDNTV